MIKKQKNLVKAFILISVALILALLILSCQRVEKRKTKPERSKPLRLLGKFNIKGKIICLAKEKDRQGKEIKKLYLFEPSTKGKKEIKGLKGEFNSIAKVNSFTVIETHFSSTGHNAYYLLDEEKATVKEIIRGNFTFQDTIPSEKCFILRCGNYKDEFVTKSNYLKVNVENGTIETLTVSTTIPSIWVELCPSPNGRYFLSWGVSESTPTILKLVDNKTGKTFIIDKAGDFLINWSPDSRYFFYVPDEGDTWVYDTKSKTSKIAFPKSLHIAGGEEWLNSNIVVYLLADKKAVWQIVKVFDGKLKNIGTFRSAGFYFPYYTFSPFGEMEIVELNQDGDLYWTRKGQKPVKIAEGLFVPEEDSDENGCLMWIK